jgi:hypothetical protein
MIIGVSALRLHKIAGLHGLTLVMRGGVGCAPPRRHPAAGTLSVAALQPETRMIRLCSTVFPVGAGFVDNLARPGGTLPGLFEFQDRFLSDFGPDD